MYKPEITIIAGVDGQPEGLISFKVLITVLDKSPALNELYVETKWGKRYGHGELRLNHEEEVVRTLINCLTPMHNVEDILMGRQPGFLLKLWKLAESLR
jgi:hypothetical protein